ncbi:MAG TPA: hypothetical protein VF610_03380 [Segetibacter sp.]
MIALFLFNLFGYRFVFDYVQQQSDKQLVAALDKDEYNEADLLILKVPLSLPYLNNQENFERVDGEITVDGKIYKYVKRKISEGNLVLLCLPDHNKMRLNSAKDDFFKYANDLVKNNHSKKSDHSKEGSFKKIISDYDSHTHELCADNPTKCIVHVTKQPRTTLANSPGNLPEQPPELI